MLIFKHEDLTHSEVIRSNDLLKHRCKDNTESRCLYEKLHMTGVMYTETSAERFKSRRKKWLLRKIDFQVSLHHFTWLFDIYSGGKSICCRDISAK